ncbi:MAG: aromatic amino acid lyase, partial [Sphingomonadaceae bacterium]|nr:aromatic amino acid lyase [Sphingomonadaceae bacterium]
MTVVLVPGEARLAQLETIWREGEAVELDDGARPAIEAAAALVREAANGDEAIYGVNTGFGKLASVRIKPEDTEQLQRNLVLSHCCGVGEPLDSDTTRLMLALKLLSIGRGASGIRWETVQLLEGLLAKG